MTPPEPRGGDQSPDEGELIARLQKQLADFDAGREVYCPCFAHEAILIPAESLRGLIERLARMEEELTQAVELIHEAIDDIEWGWNNANNHGGMIDDTTWHAGRDFVARLSRQDPKE